MQESINSVVREVSELGTVAIHNKIRCLEERIHGLVFRLFGGGSPLADEFFGAHLDACRTFLDAAYAEKYPNWNRILKGRLSHELDDQRVQFASATYNGGLVAVGKSTPLTDDRLAPAPFYFGTHYVAPSWQKSGMGILIQDYALVGARRPIYGLVAPENPALARHFKMNGILGLGTSRDRDDDGDSEELLRVVMTEDCGFKTVNRQKYPDAIVAAWANGDLFPEPLKGRVSVARLSSATDLLSSCREHFERGDVLTRCFYETEQGGPTVLFESRFLPGYGEIFGDDMAYYAWRGANLPSRS